MSDHPKIEKFADKDYRDGYLQTQVRTGVAYQMQALRAKADLNQTDFAKKIGKRQSVVSRLENTEYGKVSVQTLLDVACALNVALVVQFTSYPDFFDRTADMSIEALQPKTIQESLAEKEAGERNIHEMFAELRGPNEVERERARQWNKEQEFKVSARSSTPMGAAQLDITREGSLRLTANVA